MLSAYQTLGEHSNHCCNLILVNKRKEQTDTNGVKKSEIVYKLFTKLQDHRHLTFYIS